MKYQSIPQTELHPSVLCLGTASFGTAVESSTAFRLLDTFFERGGTFLDTAHVYGAWVPGGSGAVKPSSGIGFTNAACGNRWSLAQRALIQPFQPCIFPAYHARILLLTWTRAFGVCERTLSTCIGYTGMILSSQSPKCLRRSTIRPDEAKSAISGVRTGAFHALRRPCFTRLNTVSQDLSATSACGVSLFPIEKPAKTKRWSPWTLLPSHFTRRSDYPSSPTPPRRTAFLAKPATRQERCQMCSKNGTAMQKIESAYSACKPFRESYHCPYQCSC